ncbi:hypothetical protein Q9233_015224 [Columba guinea]|nr:hypothetical protein Q9233_015224 [Columba guinea]
MGKFMCSGMWKESLHLCTDACADVIMHDFHLHQLTLSPCSSGVPCLILDLLMDSQNSSFVHCLKTNLPKQEYLFPESHWGIDGGEEDVGLEGSRAYFSRILASEKYRKANDRELLVDLSFREGTLVSRHGNVKHENYLLSNTTTSLANVQTASLVQISGQLEDRNNDPREFQEWSNKDDVSQDQGTMMQGKIALHLQILKLDLASIMSTHFYDSGSLRADSVRFIVIVLNGNSIKPTMSSPYEEGGSKAQPTSKLRPGGIIQDMIFPDVSRHSQTPSPAQELASDIKMRKAVKKLALDIQAALPQLESKTILYESLWYDTVQP